jgi:hypothetical protein
MIIINDEFGEKVVMALMLLRQRGIEVPNLLFQGKVVEQASSLKQERIQAIVVNGELIRITGNDVFVIEEKVVEKPIKLKK